MIRIPFKSKSRGFFLLYAVLFTAVMLTIGMGVLDISLKQLSFSGIDRESVRAFYVADAALECALYEDVVNNSFATNTANTIHCNGNDQNVGAAGPGNPATWQFNFWLNKTDANERTCAVVTVSREYDVDGTVKKTTLSSLGYNTENNLCPPGGTPTRYPQVERGFKTEY